MVDDAASEDASLQIGSRVWLASADFAEHPYVEATLTSIESSGHCVVTPTDGYSQPRRVQRDELHVAELFSSKPVLLRAFQDSGTAQRVTDQVFFKVRASGTVEWQGPTFGTL